MNQMRMCRGCGQRFDPSRHSIWYCLTCRSPAVYRFICPDGKSYVGSVRYIRNRDRRGLGRSNTRMLKTFGRHPPKSWSFEILERLSPDCSKLELRRAEQHHIDRLRSWMPECGFNMNPAVWNGDGPAQRAARLRLACQLAECRERTR